MNDIKDIEHKLAKAESELQNFNIEPLQAPIRSAKDATARERYSDSVRKVGGFAAVAAAIIGFIAVSQFGGSGWLWLLPFGFGYLARKGVLEKLGAIEGAKAVLAANERARQQSLLNAASSTQLARQEYSSAIAQFSSMASTLQETRKHISTAESEYRANAFSPFWDEIERAVQSLSNFTREVESLKRSAENYARHLNGQTHNFPDYPIAKDMMPDAMAVANDLKRVIRLGLTNYHFSAIWEQRKNREVMIAGFRTVVEAVNGIDDKVRKALSDFFDKR